MSKDCRQFLGRRKSKQGRQRAIGALTGTLGME